MGLFINLIIVFIVIIIHELGHLIAGLIQGFRFELFVVGFLGIKREDDQIKTYLNTNMQLFGGVAGTSPVGDNPNNAKKYANMILAGPITSIVLAAILLLLYYFLYDFSFSEFIGFGSLASFGIFLATTIPNKSGIFFTDRKRYQRLTSNGIERETELAFIRLMATFAENNSYINANESDIEKIIDDPDYKYFGLSIKLNYQFEKNGQFNLETENEFKELSKKMPKSIVKLFNKDLEKLKNSPAQKNV